MKFLSGVWNAENFLGGTFERQGEGKIETLGGRERGERMIQELGMLFIVISSK